MTTENVRYLIDAEERATAKFKAVDKSIDQTVKRTRELGSRAKASTELVGTLANTLGSSKFGAAAGQLAQLTERMSAFSEVSRAGGFGAAAFKVGIAASVGVVSYEVGKFMGDLVWQTKQWRLELEAGMVQMDRLTTLQLRQLSDSFGRERERIDLLFNPEEQDAALRQWSESLKREVSAAASFVRRQQESVNELVNQMDFYPDALVTEQFKANLEIEKKTLEEANKRLEVLREQQRQIEYQTSAQKKSLDVMRDQKRLFETQNSLVDSLTVQMKTLESGEFIGELTRLKQLGLSEEIAFDFASLSDNVRELQKLKQEAKSFRPTDNRAIESRAGAGRNEIFNQQKEAEFQSRVQADIAETTKQSKDLLKRILDRLNTPTPLEVVGG